MADTTSKIQIVATARDNASAQLKTLSRNIQQVGAASSGIGTKTTGPLGRMLGGLAVLNPTAIAAGIGIGVMTGALADGIAGALEEEKQLGRLDQALKANVKGWDGNTDAIERATTAAMDFAFSDDAARESVIKLVTATGDVNKSLAHTRLAMDIARGRNIDLATATDIVIKANMGNVGALRRMGIELDKASTSTEILATLQQRYAGQAEAYAKTTAGKFESAQKKVDDAMEGVGHELITVTGGLLGFNDAMKGNTTATVDFLDAMNAFVPGMGFVADHVETEFERLGSSARTLPKDVAGALRAGREDITDAMIDALGPGTRALETWTEQADRFGDAFTDNLADSLRGNKDTVEDAMADLTFAMNHPLELQQEGARIAGALSSAELAEGLASNNPMIKAVAQQTKADLEAQWLALTGEAYFAGANAAEALARGLSLFDPVTVKPYIIPGGRFGGKHIPDGQRASGGPVDAGQTYLVGEKGPELLHMGGNGSVTPNHQLGGSSPINVYLDGKMLFQVMDERMGRRLSRTPAGVVNRG